MERKEHVTCWILKVEKYLSAREKQYHERIQDGNDPIDFSPILFVVDGILVWFRLWIIGARKNRTIHEKL